MDILKNKIDYASRLYNANLDHIPATLQIIEHAMFLLKKDANYDFFGSFTGKNVQEYCSFTYHGECSRPIRDDIFISDFKIFSLEFKEFHTKLRNIGSTWSWLDSQRANKIIYTSVMSVACCFDLWKKGSRKTPGTFFEIFMAAILKWMLPNETFSKHIPLLDEINENPGISDSSSVSTDIVIRSSTYSNRNIVIPLKITTRERIVQPFAQQRILNSFFGENIYFSFLACISETQQDKNKKKVNQICLPGTIKLYQKHLSSISGLYYCDIPERYLGNDLTDIIPVKSMGEFLIDVYLFFK